MRTGVDCAEAEALSESEARESADWFLALPEERQREFRAHWEAESERWEDLLRRRRVGVLQPVLEGAALFGAVELGIGLLTRMRWDVLLYELVLGALLGLSWLALGARELLRPITATAVYFLAQGAWIGLGSPNTFAFFLGPLFAGAGAAYLGSALHRE